MESVTIGLLHAAAAKSLQSCPTLCDPIDRLPPGSSILGKPNEAVNVKHLAQCLVNKGLILQGVQGMEKTWTAWSMIP